MAPALATPMSLATIAAFAAPLRQRLHEWRGLEPDCQQPESEPAAERQRVLPPGRADGKRRNREIDIVGEALPGHSLKDQRQGEAGLQLDDDGLHAIALRFEESLYRGIEGVFAHGPEAAMNHPKQ